MLLRFRNPVGEWHLPLPLIVIQRNQVYWRRHQLRHHRHGQLRDSRLGMWRSRHAVRDTSRYPRRERKRSKDGHGISHQERRRRGPREHSRRRRHSRRSGSSGGPEELSEAEVLPHAEGYVDEERGREGRRAHGCGSVVPLRQRRGGVCCDVRRCVQGPDYAQRLAQEEGPWVAEGGR